MEEVIIKRVIPTSPRNLAGRVYLPQELINKYVKITLLTEQENSKFLKNEIKRLERETKDKIKNLKEGLK